MNTEFKFLLASLAILGLAACATTPQQRYASSIKAAQAANRPVVVYQFLASSFSYRLRSYDNWGYQSDVGLGFINASTRPIKSLTFVLAYDDHNHPVLGGNGKPFEDRVVADGPFPPGVSRAVISRINWPGRAPSVSFACPKLTGMNVTYQDGSTMNVPTAQLGEYAVPDLYLDCAYYNIHWAWAPNLPSVADHSAPYTIPWMVTYEPGPNPSPGGASMGRGRG